MAFSLTVNVHVDVHQIGAGALLEALHHDSDAVRDLVPHEEQRLFADDLGDQLLFRHIGISVVIEVMRTLDSILTQRIKQLLAMVIGADADGVNGIEHAERLQLCLAGFEVRRFLDEVSLVDDCNGGAAALAQRIHQNHFRLVERTVRLEQHH